MIEKLAAALEVDSAKFLTTQSQTYGMRRGALASLTVQFTRLSFAKLGWIEGIPEAALAPQV